MNEENKSKLNNLFTEIKNEKNKIKEEEEIKKNEEEQFLEDFKKLCENIIEPKMQEFKIMLNENGYGCNIFYSAGDKSSQGIKADPNIKLQISKNIQSNFSSANKFPHIMFTANKFYKKIGIHESTIFQNSGGTSGMRGDKTYTIETLTEQNIEKEIVKSIENILKNKY